jgi:DNA polymerase III epsilon subunit-like protein
MVEERIVWVDLETGGVDENEHQITQFAAVATGGPPLFKEPEQDSEFERKVALVSGKWTDEALKLQAYDPVVWKAEGKTVVEVLDDFDLWIKKHCHEAVSGRTGNRYQVAHMAGHNAGFDGRFLRAAAERNDRWIRLTNWTGGIYDTLQLAKWYFLGRDEQPENLRLETLCKFFGISMEAHDALEDVRATIKIARRMIK